MRNILVIDDELLIRYALAATFRNPETEVTTASTGIDALKALAGQEFDACLIDINLPDMNGLEIMRKVRRDTPRTVIIIMTGGEVRSTAMDLIRENASMMIGKPFDLDVVKNFVDRMLLTGKPLYRDEVLTLKNSASFIKWLVADMRKHDRRTMSRDILCSPCTDDGVSGQDSFAGRVLDISESGICIQTSDPLRPGYVVALNDHPIQCRGVVRWSKVDVGNSSFRVGIQFMN